MANDWFRLNVSDQAYNAVHERYNGSDIEKGDFNARLIRAGMKSLVGMPRGAAPIKQPNSGSRTIQIKKKTNASLFAEIDNFCRDKNFYDRHYAARYCLYSELGIATN